ncbi:hypothetical protein QQF64_023606, partial [Cirrhinus molitorella]
GPTVKPSVSLLPPSSLQISGDSAALLCLLSSYSPQGAQVSWTLDGSEVTEGVVTSAESERNGWAFMQNPGPEPQQSMLGRGRAVCLQSKHMMELLMRP